MKSSFQALVSIIFTFVLSTLLSSTTVQAQPKVPDPFCSPKDFFNYLNQKNRDRVLYVVQKCPNIDLNEKGPKQESFAETLALTGWEDIFAIVIQDKTVLLENHISSLIKNSRYPWLVQLIDRSTFQISEAQLLEALKNPKNSELFFQKLIDSQKINMNQAFAKEPTTLVGAALSNKAWDLYDLFTKIPNADLSETWKVSCSYAQSGPMADAQRFVKIQKELLQTGKANANLPCLANALPIITALSGGYDLELIDLLLARSELTFAAPGISYRALELAAARTSAPFPESVVVRILQQPTFNQNDKNGSKNLWNLLAEFVGRTSVGTAVSKILATQLTSLSPTTVNEHGAFWTLIRSMIGRVDFMKNPIVDLFFANPHLNINQMENGRSALVIAAAGQSLNTVQYLLQKGIDTVNIGSLKNDSSRIIEFIGNNTKYFDLFFNRSDLDINTTSSSKMIMLLELLLMNGSQSSLDLMPRVYKDPRFNAIQFDHFIRFKFCPITAAVLVVAEKNKLNAGQIPMELAELSTDVQLHSYCSLDSVRSNVLQWAAFNGQLNLVKYLWKERKVPMRDPRTDYTAFGSALSNQKWDIVRYFIEAGYIAELNGRIKYDFDDKAVIQTEFSVLATILYRYKPELLDLAKKIMALPSFDPNVKPYNATYSSVSILATVLEEKNLEIFNILVQNPKLIIGEALPRALPWYNEKEYNPIFFDSLLAKFKIKTDLDKAVAIKTLQQMHAARYPVSFFSRIASLPNFDVNFPVEFDIDPGKTKATLLASYFSISESTNDDYIQALFKIKNLKPSAPSNPHPILRLLNSKVKIEVIQKYFNLFYAHPATVHELPFPDADFIKNFEAYMTADYSYRNEKFYIARAAAFILLNPKLKLTKEHVTRFFEYRNWFDLYYTQTPEQDFFLDAFFSSPHTKPYTQWNSILSELQLDRDGHLQFIKKHGDKLDLNYRKDEKSSSLLERSMSEQRKSAFDFLVSNPKVSVVGALAKATSWYDPYYVITLVSKRGKEIPPAELLSGLDSILSGNTDLKRPPTDQVKAILPFLKSLDGLTKVSLTRYRDAPLTYILKLVNLDPIFQQLFQRVWTEDKSILEQTVGLVEEMFQQKRWDLFRALVDRGYDLKRPIDELSLLAYSVRLKDLELLKYLASKGVAPKTGCDPKYGYYNCKNDPFWQSLILGWFEGADYLISIGADPNLLTAYDGSSLKKAMELKNTVIVEFLISRNVRVNSTGALALAVAQQNDPLFNLFLGTKGIDANDRALIENRHTFPIIEAARFGRIDYVRALLAVPGVQKNIQDSDGYRAIDWAATNGFLEIVELLKKN